MPRSASSVGERRRRDRERSLRDRVGDLARHRAEVRAGGDQHDAPAVALELRGELLHEQERRAHVLVQEGVEVPAVSSSSRPCPLRAWLTTSTSSGPSASRAAATTRAGASGSAKSASSDGVEASRRLPRLGCVVRRPALREDVRAGLLERRAIAKPMPARRLTPVTSAFRIAQVVRTPTTSRTASELACRACSCTVAPARTCRAPCGARR